MSMGFLMELILELLFEVPIEAAMESKRLKTGVKSVLFCVIGGLITSFFAYLTVITWIEQDNTSAVFMTAITVVFLAGVVFGAIRGHKKKWKTT